MKTTKHTPGPWETGAKMTSVQVMPKGWRMPMCVADCHPKNAPEDEAERCANARLIAAAPDLLAACEVLHELQVKAINHVDSTLEELAESRDLLWAAIIKAKPHLIKEL